MRKLRQAKPVAKTAVKAIKPKSSGKRKGDDDEDSIDDSGSELGWDSEEDQTFRHDEEDYDDEDEEGGILLSDMIGRAPTKAPVQSTKAKKRPIEVDYEVDEEVEEEEEMDEDEDVNTSDADDMDEEEEGEGDDQEDDDEGEEEGSGDDMFNALSDGEDEEGFSGEDDYDSAEDGDHDQLVATITNKLAAPTAAKSKLSAFSSMPESQTYATGGKVTLHALMDAIDDTRGISAVKAQLTSLDTSKGAPMYVDKVTAERIERTAAYAGRSADMEKWQDTVLTNRAAAQLDLANDKKYVPTYRSLVRKFSPRSAFEKEVAMVVTSRPKAEETNALRAEAAALAARHADISMEEIQQKQADLAKVNKLMFYEQMKRHRINKIKSKAFRAIARKGRKRAQGQGQGQEDGEGEEEDLAELRDANAHARVKERMDLKHSNTSKWAKMALAHGHANKSLRDAYHEQVRLGQQLTEKMHEEVGGGVDGEAEGDYDASSSIAQQSRAEVSDYLKALDAAPEAEAGGKFGKLFAMDFMQKAAAKQKEEAKETARALLKEIEQMERQADGDHDHDDDSDREAEGRGPKVSVQQSAQRALERKAAAEEVASMMTMSAGMRLQPRSTSQGVQKEEVAAASNPWLSAARPSAASTPKVVAVAVPLPSAAASGETKTKGKSKGKAADKEKGAKADDSHQSKRTAAASSSGTSSGVPPSAAVDSAEAPAAPSAKPAAASSSKAALSLTHRSQAELVAAAFAGPDYAADFAASKAQQVDDELGIKAKQMAVLKNVKAGWGDWAGPGAMEVSPRILAIRDRAMLKVQKENDVQRLQRKDFHKQTVILSERRSKAAAKYKVVDVPYPFTCREDYERSLQMPLGEEWNAMHVVSKMTEPEVKTRSGRIIEPIALAKGKVSELAQQKQSLPKGNKHKGKKQRTG